MENKGLNDTEPSTAWFKLPKSGAGLKKFREPFFSAVFENVSESFGDQSKNPK